MEVDVSRPAPVLTQLETEGYPTQRADIQSLFMLIEFFDDAAIFKYDQRISSISTGTLDTNEIFMMNDGAAQGEGGGGL